MCADSVHVLLLNCKYAHQWHASTQVFVIKLCHRDCAVKALPGGLAGEHPNSHGHCVTIYIFQGM